MNNTVTSTAHVTIERPSRWGKQLTNHLKRKVGGEWDAETLRGWIDLPDGMKATVVAQENTPQTELELTVEASPEQIERAETVLGGHLARFAAAHNITVQWSRSDGTAGSTQEAVPADGTK